MLQAPRLNRYNFVWRGVSDIAYRLDPGIVRKIAKDKYSDAAQEVTEEDVAAAEEQLLHDARLNGFHRLESGQLLTDDQLRARLQHQGAATRLLDVTSNALIALWMATHNERKDDDVGALFAIDWTADRPGPQPETVAEMVQHPRVTWLWKVGMDVDPRIRSQSGAFLVGRVPEREPDRTRSSLALNFPDYNIARLFADAPGSGNYPASPTVIFRLTRDVKVAARDFLNRVVGMNPATIFPDIAGFAQAHSA
ncbi:FRG domain-containing protein [Georgenia sp. Marseille-Q6866]